MAGYNIHTFSLSVVQIGHTPCSLPTWYNWHTPLNSLWHWRWRQLLLRTVGVYIVIHGIKIQVIVMRWKSVVKAENCYKFPFFFVQHWIYRAGFFSCIVCFVWSVDKYFKWRVTVYDLCLWKVLYYKWTHFLQTTTLHKHAVTVVIVAIQVSAATAQWWC